MLACKHWSVRDANAGGRQHTGVGVLLGPNVVKLDGVTALEAALKRAITGDLKHGELVFVAIEVPQGGGSGSEVIRSTS